MNYFPELYSESLLKIGKKKDPSKRVIPAWGAGMNNLRVSHLGGGKWYPKMNLRSLEISNNSYLVL